jgi:hypothetical protein
LKLQLSVSAMAEGLSLGHVPKGHVPLGDRAAL